MSRVGTDWQDLTYQGEPSLLFGWRPSPRRLMAGRVAIDRSAFDSLETIADGALQSLTNRSAVDYGTWVTPDPEEFLSLPRGTGPLTTTTDLTETESGQVSELLELLDNASALDDLTGDQAAEVDSICYVIQKQTDAGETISFVKASSPTAVLRRGRFFFSGSTLQAVARPDVALAGDVDLIVTGDEVAILNRTAFDRLFSDTDYAAAEVETNLQRVVDNFPQGLSISSDARDALAAECARLKSLAKRLHALSEDPVIAQLTPARIRAALRRHPEPSSDFINARGQLTFSTENVKAFLDLIEDRWWTSDFRDEPRRADRFRSR